jgi:hypothetical protein
MLTGSRLSWVLTPQADSSRTASGPTSPLHARFPCDGELAEQPDSVLVSGSMWPLPVTAPSLIETVCRMRSSSIISANGTAWILPLSARSFRRVARLTPSVFG